MAPEPPAAIPNSGAVASAVTAAQTQTLQHFAEIVVEHVPDRLAQVARTILLSGMITSQQEGGALVLRTQVGDLIIRSQIPLPMDRVLTLQIPPGAPPVRAQVLLMPSAQQPLLAPASPSPVGVGVIASAHSPRQGAVVSSAPVLPQVAQTLSLQAITEVPLQPGLLLPAKIMALPTAPVLSPLPVTTTPQTLPLPQLSEGQPAPLPNASPMPAPASSPTLPANPVVLPKGLAVPPELMQGLSTQTLRSVLPQNLTDVIAKLPPAVMVPQMRATAPTAPVTSAVALPQMPVLPTAPQVSSQPAFALLPSLLTLPPGAQVMVQIEKVLPPILPNEVVSPTPQTQSQPQEPPILPAQKQPLPLAPVADKTLPAPVSLEAIVVAKTAQGEPVATSPAGLLILESRAPLPEGTRLVVNLVHVAEPVVPDESPLPAQPKDWPVLQQIMPLLSQSGAAQPALVAKPEKVGEAVIFLLAALRFGKAEDVVGEDAASTLRQSARGASLLSQLEGELRQTSQSWNKPPEALAQGEWRTLTLPLPSDAQLSRLAVHLRHEREAEAESGSSAPVKHLVLEVEMSRLGPLLLDGYIRKSRFDLTLRSQRRLPQSLIGELRQAYNDTLAITGWHGEIAFQTAAELWLKG